MRRSTLYSLLQGTPPRSLRAGPSTRPQRTFASASAAAIREVDEDLDFSDSSMVGVGVERMVAESSRGSGSRRSFIQAKIAQHDRLHPSPFAHPYPVQAASPSPSSFTPGFDGDLTAGAIERNQGRHPLVDKHRRKHGYLRISLTERCNLRCTYCMPDEHGITLSPTSHILTNPEILKLSSLFVSQGVHKIRLTGGEPTLRKGLPDLIRQLGEMRDQGLRTLGMTSNGVALGGRSDAGGKLRELVNGGLTHLNLSLDTLDEAKFEQITRRRGFSAVLNALDHALSHLTTSPLSPSLSSYTPGLRSIKLNSVLTRSTNLSELIPFVNLTKDRPISVRFIEFMPFSGNEWDKGEMVSYEEALGVLRREFGGDLEMVRDGEDDGTSKRWRVKGYKGEVGFISSMSDHFCGTCNRLRITADGNLKVCLFDNTEVSLRDVLRAQGATPRQIDEQLLDVIAVAVGNKKPKHAGMDILQSMKNRSMVMIGG